MNDTNIEQLINDYLTRELMKKPELGLKNDNPLLESWVFNSLPPVKLVLFLEQKFGIAVPPEELLSKDFETMIAICTYVRSKQER